MKLHLPHLLRNALLAALLCCTMAFGTVTVTVDDQPSSLEQLTETPKGSVKITVKDGDGTLNQKLKLDGGVDHYIDVEEGSSLTVTGGLIYDAVASHQDPEDPGSEWWYPEHYIHFSCSGGKVIFAAGESKLGGAGGFLASPDFFGDGGGAVVVKQGATLMLNCANMLPTIEIEKGGELVAGGDVTCFALEGKGTLRFDGITEYLPENRYDGEISIFGIGGTFEGTVEGKGWIDVEGTGIRELGYDAGEHGAFMSAEQTLKNVIAEETELSTCWGNVVLDGSKNEFQMIELGDSYNISYYSHLRDEFPSASLPAITDTLLIEAGTKVSVGIYPWQQDDSDPADVWDPGIDDPVVKRGGFSFLMEDRSKLVMKYGKGETGAKITASGTIVLTTTTWNDTTTKLAVHVEFAESPGRDFKQILIQADKGIVLTSMGYKETGYGEYTEFSLLKQYTDENSEDELNKWLKENVTVTVNGYEDPYLMVEKKGGSQVELYVAAGDVADLPDDPIDPIPDNPEPDTPGTDTPGTDTPGTDTPGTDTPGASNPDTIFAPLATSWNMQAGAGMLYHAMNRNLPSSSELKKVVSAIEGLARIGQGEQPAVAMAAMSTESGTPEMLIRQADIDPAVARSEAQRLMTAVPGSSVPALGAAQRDAMRGQLSRATSQAARAGREAARATDSSQGMRVWMEGMGGSSNLDRDGDESGYEHNAWGASVGVEKALQGGATTIGLSLVASYGDLKVDSVDYAEGDLDTYYVNLYAHHRSGNFHHSFAASVGLSDAELNRTVRGGVAPYVVDYDTNGSTNGTGFGVAYELAYDIALNEQKSSILQPVIGVSLVTTKMDGYDEGGAGDAGLHVGEQESTLTMLTAGARFLSQCGEEAFGRAAVLEMRANVAVDMGDRRSEADVSFLGDRGCSGRVRSAETGAVGAQLGASVSVPVSSSTSIYVNGEADLRSGSNTWSVGAGASVMF